MFSVNRKLCLPLIAITVLSSALAAPVLAGNIIGSVFPITNSDNLYESNVSLAYNTDMQEYLAVWYKDTVEDEIWAQRLDKDGDQSAASFNLQGGRARPPEPRRGLQQPGKSISGGLAGPPASATVGSPSRLGAVSPIGAVLDPSRYPHLQLRHWRPFL